MNFDPLITEDMEDVCSSEPPVKKHKSTRDTALEQPSEEESSSKGRRADVGGATDKAGQIHELPESDVKYEAYYSANFKAVLSSVISDSPERNVITDEAVRTVERFMSLPEPQQQLYVRLFLRKHQWIRVNKLSYANIAADLEPVCSGLTQEKFVLDETQLADPSIVLNLLQVHELKKLCKQLNLPLSVTGSQKGQIVEALFKHDRQHKPLFGSSPFLRTVVKKAKVFVGRCVRVAEDTVEVFSRLMLLFSLVNSWMEGDEDNSFSQIIYKMLQISIGRLVYPQYEISVSQPLFSSHQEFERYYSATMEEQHLQIAIEEDDSLGFDRVLQVAKRAFQAELDQTVNCPPLPYLLPFTPGWIHGRVLSQCAEHLEKKGKYRDANEILRFLLSQDVYCLGSRGRWWDRLALNLDYHLKMKETCLETIQAALKDTRIRKSRRLALIQRARKICQRTEVSRKNSSAQKLSKRSENEQSLECSKFVPDDFPEMVLIPAPEVHITGKQYHADKRSVFISYNSTEDKTATSSPSHSLLGVEDYALQHYHSREDWPCGLHAESSTFTAMFCLLLWDIIFASGIPDVFRTPHQGGPLDLYTDHFYLNRRADIETRLTWIKTASSEEISAKVSSIWQRHHGQVCVGLNWDLFPSLDDAKNLAVCMGGDVLSRVCEVFAKHYSQSRGGLPDLTLWDPALNKCKFVEVKGPGDRLSLKQIVWLSRLLEWGCAAEVCRVANSKGV